jgi:hypothetical protein
MVKDGGAWKIDSLEFGWPDAPDGAKVIKVQANEFAFSPQDEPDSQSRRTRPVASDPTTISPRRHTSQTK